MDNVKDLIEKLQILPWDMPIEILTIGVHMIDGVVRVSCGTSPDNINMLWLKDIDPEMKETISQLHRLAYERMNAERKLNDIARRFK